MGDVTQNFSRSEFTCPCCGENKIEDTFIIWLQRVRDEYGHPMQITSGYRCKKHNDEVRGSNDSAHLYGLACDVLCTDSTKRYELMEAALKCNTEGLGTYGAHVHVDMRSRGAKVAW